MAYASWSVVFGEQPSAAKWNILGTNDASFNDGTGIFGLYKDLLATDSNPYKFSAYKSSGTQTINAGATDKVTFDAEEYDTNGNFATSTYTVPVTGFYLLIAGLGNNAVASATRLVPIIYVNGSPVRRGNDRDINAAAGQVQNVTMQSLTAGNTVEVYGSAVGANIVVNNTQANTFFQAMLLCRT